MDRKNEIICELFEKKIIDEIMHNFSIKKNDWDDFMQEIYLILLEYDSDKLFEMYEKKQLKWFIIKIIQNQYFSKNSTFYCKYKKYYNIINDIKKEAYNIQEND